MPTGSACGEDALNFFPGTVVFHLNSAGTVLLNLRTLEVRHLQRSRLDLFEFSPFCVRAGFGLTASLEMKFDMKFRTYFECMNFKLNLTQHDVQSYRPFPGKYSEICSTVQAIRASNSF